MIQMLEPTATKRFVPGWTQRLFWILLIALAQGPLLAQQPADWTEPSYPIESIRIDGLNYSRPDPVLTELRLVEGRTYREVELRQAIYRARRLPYVLRADMRLEKGTEHGRYVLVVEIEETRRLFLVYDGLFRYRPSQTFKVLDPFSDPPGQPRTVREPATWEHPDADLTLGGRLFVGRSGMAFATLSDNGAGLGYTQYNLFGSRSFLTGAVKQTFSGAPTITERDDLGFIFYDDLEFSLSMGLPLAGNHSLQLSLSSNEGDSSEFEAELDSRSRGVEARWFYDTTDDPFFPDRGQRISAGGAFFRNESHSEIGVFESVLESDETVWFASGAHYFPLSARGTLSLGADLRLNRSDFFDSRQFEFEEELFDAESTGIHEFWRSTGSVGYTHTLIEPQDDRRHELRLETNLEARFFDEDRGDDLPRFFSAFLERELQLNIGLAYRNRWSVIRLGFGYVDQELGQ